MREPGADPDSVTTRFGAAEVTRLIRLDLNLACVEKE
jgi:hypothetical protein